MNEEVQDLNVDEAATAEISKEEEEKLRQERIAACNKEMSAVLQKYGCTLDAHIMLRAGQVLPNIQIVPVELMQAAQDQAAPAAQ